MSIYGEAKAKLEILFEDNHILAVKKPCNIPVQEDASKDLDMLNICKNYIKINSNKPGAVYLALIHRLDRPVGGVLIFAKTSKAAARLSKQIADRVWTKSYIAIVSGVPEEKSGILEGYIIRDRENNKSSIININNFNNSSNNKNNLDKQSLDKQSPDKPKLAKLSYNIISTKNNLSLLEINLETGRHHQIRVQLANINLPIWGDQKYNTNAEVGQQIALWANSVEFIHPVLKNLIKISAKPDNNFPWNNFNLDI